MAPPRELVQQWMTEVWHEGTPVRVAASDLHIAAQAARWGYGQRGAVNEAALQKAKDEELEACCEWLVAGQWFSSDGRCIKDLRAARRPKPKSQAEEAIAELDGIATCFFAGFGGDLKCDTIRAALERLRELEKQADD